MRRTTTSSPSTDSSRVLRVGEISAITTVGWLLSVLKRTTVGGRASRGRAPCTIARRSRTSCIARLMSASSVNSTLVWLRPSKLRDVMRLTPAMLFSDSSTSLVTSRSTASGLAPG